MTDPQAGAGQKSQHGAFCVALNVDGDIEFPHAQMAEQTQAFFPLGCETGLFPSPPGKDNDLIQAGQVTDQRGEIILNRPGDMSVGKAFPQGQEYRNSHNTVAQSGEPYHKNAFDGWTLLVHSNALKDD